MAEEKPSREANVPPPKCKAILLCERAIVEEGTGQISLIGLFERLKVPACQAMQDRSWFICCYGRYRRA